MTKKTRGNHVRQLRGRAETVSDLICLLDATWSVVAAVCLDEEWWVSALLVDKINTTRNVTEPLGVKTIHIPSNASCISIESCGDRSLHHDSPRLREAIQARRESPLLLLYCTVCIMLWMLLLIGARGLPPPARAPQHQNDQTVPCIIFTVCTTVDTYLHYVLLILLFGYRYCIWKVLKRCACTTVLLLL